MQGLSEIRVSRLRPRPPPDYSLLAAPAGGEKTPGYRYIEGVSGLISRPIPTIVAPRRRLRLKTIHPTTANNGPLPIVKAEPRKQQSTLSRLSKPAQTSPAKPPFHVSKRPILGETSRNITPVPNQPAVQGGVWPSSENCHKSSNSTVKSKNPHVTLKLQNKQRPTVLPKAYTVSPFSSPQRSPDHAQRDLFCDSDANSTPTVRRTCPEALSPCPNPSKSPVNNASPADVEGRSRPRSALSLRSYLDHDTGKLHVSKTVRFDPAIIVAGHVVVTSPGNTRSTDETADIANENRQHLVQKLDVEDCVETLREWKRHDRGKLQQLLEALKQIDFDADEVRKDVEAKTQSPPKVDDVMIPELKTLNPRVASFHPVQEGSDLIHSQAKMTLPTHLATQPAIANKENIAPLSLRCNPTVVTTPVKPRKSASASVPVRKPPICDDRGAPGREVDAFEQWYADKQLVEFMRKYPLTGKKVAGVVTPQKLAREREKVSSPEKVRRATSMKGDGAACGSDGMGGGRKELGAMDLEVVRARKRERERDRHAGFFEGRSPLVGRHAAVLQQRLEFLLLRERERKAKVEVGWA